MINHSTYSLNIHKGHIFARTKRIKAKLNFISKLNQENAHCVYDIRAYLPASLS